MIITATPQPENFPPRVRLDFDAEGAEFLELTVLRDGRPIRQQPAVGGLSEVHVYDYEAPFGVPVTYTASGAVAGGWAAVRAESWPDLTGWTTVSGVPLVWSGRFRVEPSAGGVAVVKRDLTDLAGAAVRLTLPSRESLTNPSSPAGVTAGVGFGNASFVAKTGDTFGLQLGTEFIPMPIASTGAVTLTVAADRRSVSAVHGSTRVDRPASVSTTELVARAYAAGASVGPFTVEVATRIATSASTTATLDVPDAWLIHPIQPAFSMPIEQFRSDSPTSVESSTDNQRTYAARQAIYQPAGRREAVVFPLGPRAAGSWTLVLNTHSIDERNDLMTLLDDQAPVLLRSPALADWDLPDGWYAVGDVQVERPIDIGANEWRKVSLPLTRVAEPPVRLAPTLTWGDLMLRGVTWGDLLSKTWLDALMGEV